MRFLISRKGDDTFRHGAFDISIARNGKAFAEFAKEGFYVLEVVDDERDNAEDLLRELVAAIFVAETNFRYAEASGAVTLFGDHFPLAERLRDFLSSDPTVVTNAKRSTEDLLRDLIRCVFRKNRLPEKLVFYESYYPDFNETAPKLGRELLEFIAADQT